MNTKFMNKMLRIAVANNYKYIELKSGFMFYADSADEYYLIYNSLVKIRNIRIIPNICARSITAYHINDYEEMKAANDRKNKLVNIFFAKLKENGGDQNAAQAAQKEYAEQIGGMAEYNLIYN